MATYKDLLEAGRVNTIRPIRDDERNKLPAGWDTVDRYAPYDPESVAHRGDWGNADNAFLNETEWNAVQGYKKQYEDAKLIGDQEGMRAAHEAAEQLRYKHGYTGGIDGTGYDVVLADVTGLPQSGGDGYGGSGGGASGYQSQYQSMIDSLLSGILNRDPFSYNKDTDELYQQYEESYTRGGNRAMQDTLAQMSARTGGLASSYAGSAAQQTYNNYMAQLADKVPELQQLAYSMYMDEISQQRQDLSTVLGIDDMYYGRYRDTVADQQWQQQFDYNAYRDLVGDSQWQQSFDYNASRDQVGDQQWQQQFDYGVNGDKQKLAQSQVDAILSAGGTPSAELLAQAGYSDEYAAALGMYYQQKNAPKYKPAASPEAGPKEPVEETADTAHLDTAMRQLDGERTMESKLAALDRWFTNGTITEEELDALLDYVGA